MSSEPSSDSQPVPGEKLTPKECAVLVHMLAGLGVQQAAKLAGVGERTVWTWLRENEPFKRELRSRQRQAMDAVTRKLQSSSDKAVEALERVMGDATAPHGAVVSAARAVLDTAYRGVEVADLAQRIEELEGAAEQAKKRSSST
ncbi:MAG: hypothetical protein RLZZ450_315 [Pseudomonadota bacterium]